MIYECYYLQDSQCTCQPEGLQPLVHLAQEALGVDSVLEPGHPSSRPEAPPLQALTEPDVSLSTHPALPIRVPCPHSSRQCANKPGLSRAMRSSQ